MDQDSFTSKETAEFTKLGQWMADCNLSPREVEIASYFYIMDGELNNKTMALHFFVCIKTIKYHLTSIYQKTKTNGRNALFIAMVRAAGRIP
jgi:DNA-binding NarL/FixJ family response regulator